MTATTAPDWEIVSDAELAEAAANGDRVALAEIYDRYANRLHDFCLSMVRNPEAAADCVQDTFYTAATRLPSLRDPSRLRPWLYAIARNEALRHIRERGREQPCDALPEMVSPEPEPDIVATRTELSALVAEAASGLSDRDRAVLELTYRHGLDGPELAEALGVSTPSARTLAHRLKQTIERSLGALLVARQARTVQECPELGTLLADWDGRFTILMRKRIARHIDSCSVCDEQRRGLVNPVTMLGGAPLFIPAPDWLRERTLSGVELTCADTAMTDPPSGDDPDSDGAGSGARSRHGLIRAVLLVGAAAIAALGLAIIWPSAEDIPLSPVRVTDTTSPPRPAPSPMPITQVPGGNPPAPPAATVGVPSQSLPAPSPQPNANPVVPSGADPITESNPMPPPPPVLETPIDVSDTAPAETAPQIAVPTAGTGSPAPQQPDSSGSPGGPSGSSSDSSGSPGSSTGSAGSSGSEGSSSTSPDSPDNSSDSPTGPTGPTRPTKPTKPTGSSTSSDSPSGSSSSSGSSVSTKPSSSAGRG